MQTWKTINSKPLIERMRGATWFMFITAHVQVLCFLFVFYSPSVQATIENIEQQNAVPEVQGNTDEEKLGNALQLIKENVADTKATVDARLEEEGGIIESILDFFGLSSLQNESINTLVGLNDQVNTLNEKALEGFAEVEAMLIAKQLPDEIMQRHHEAVNKYKADYQKLQGYIQDAANAESLHEQQDAMDALNAFFEQQKFKRSHQTDDPNNLPFGSPDAEKTRKPITDSQQLSQLINPIEESQLAEKVLDTLIPKAYAQTGTGPTTADLAETIDVQLTDAIRAKAAELNNSPVEIYNWVRNNIEFIPSYGSIQGANYTLESLKGNAFDTSSLLIALLRAANIPARYAYGTVRIPSEQVMNWVGGVDVPEAAQQLLGQGGIPNSGLINGGQITHITMEHIWVEAWVDFEPSRAAKNIQGDSWVPLDASFKQYEFTEEDNLEEVISFDAQNFIDQTLQTAIISNDGNIQNIDSSQIETALTNYQQEVQNFADNNTTDSTVGEIISLKKVIIKEHKQLFSGLPYNLVLHGDKYSTLPDNLRHKFRYTIGSSSFGREAQRLVTVERFLPELAGKKIALSFNPFSDEDQELLDSFFPKPDPVTGIIDPTRIPQSLPGYLIEMKLEFSIENELVEGSNSIRMGQEMYETLALWSPVEGWKQSENKPISGEYRAIGIDFHGISEQQLEKLDSDINQTKDILEEGDASKITGLTKKELLGDLLSSTILNYLALTNAQNKLLARTTNIVNYRMPSYGVFSTSLRPNYLFGIIPRGVNFAGLTIDVDRLAVQGVSKNNDVQNRINYVVQSGAIASAMEHIVPESHFSIPGDPVQGISAVKALSIANQEGQRIWTIDRSNLTQALNAINLSRDTEREIAGAVNAGKIATAHEFPINFAGGTNEGYLLLDPTTGGGAYKIAGGGNGGFLDWVNENSALLTGIGIGASLIAFLTASTGGIVFLLAAVVAIVLAISLAIASFLAFEASLRGTRCQGGALLALFAGLQVAAIIIGAFAGGIFGALAASMFISLLANAVPASATSATCPPNNP